MRKKRIISFLLAIAVFIISTGTAINSLTSDLLFPSVSASEVEEESDDVSGGETENVDGGTEDTGGENGGYADPASEGTYQEDESLTPPDVSYSKAALLMDMNTGRMIYGKNVDVKMYPASTTKMMTCILALEMGNLSDTVTANYQALASITLDDSQMGILIGEEFTLEQLIYGMMVHSANDAANVIAIHIAGSIDAFVELMNQKTQELGMTNTHFVNACGVHDDNHYTTARDLAILARYAMQNETFREVVKTVVYKIPPTSKYKVERILTNTNLFLSTIRSLQHVYPPCTGIKTGHTSQSGYCLVASAEYNDTNLLAVSMGCPNTNDNEGAYSYIDTKNMFQFGFDNYQHQVIASPGDMVADKTVNEAKNNLRVALTVDNEVSALIPSKPESAAEIVPEITLPEVVNAPVAKGDVIGTVTYSYKGTQIGAANLVATNDVELNYVLHVFNIVVKVIKSPFFFIPVILLIVIAIAAYRRKKKMERKRRIQQIRRNRQAGAENELNRRIPDRNASRTERQRSESKGSNSRYGDSNQDRK